MSKAVLKMAKVKGLKKEDAALLDTHRVLAKAVGGTYVDENYVVMQPVEHMAEHGNLRVRNCELETIKTIIDDRQQVMRMTMKVQNQLLAYKRLTDVPNPATAEWLEAQLVSFKKALADRDKVLYKTIKEYAKTDGLTKAALGVKGIGPVTVAYCLTYIDLEKARHASSLWAYAGLDKPSHERYEKGKTGGGNKTLRSILYTMADSQVKTRGAYREVYDRVKDRLAQSEKIVNSRNTQGKMVEVMWKDAKPCHRHGAALRAVMKHFLADYWKVGRTLLGFPADPLYAEAVLGGSHRTVQPEARGWEF